MDASKSIGAQFFAGQDRLRGGPDPDLATSDYKADIVGFPPLDLAGHQGFATAFYAAFPDLQHRVEQVVAEGDQESVRFSLVGTHKGEFNGIPATGKQVEVAAFALFTVRDGRVAHLRGLFDQLGMLQELGVIPRQ
jgi:predicted ester cyclase